jgi:hypothetical protein
LQESNKQSGNPDQKQHGRGSADQHQLPGRRANSVQDGAPPALGALPGRAKDQPLCSCKSGSGSRSDDCFVFIVSVQSDRLQARGGEPLKQTHTGNLSATNRNTLASLPLGIPSRIGARRGRVTATTTRARALGRYRPQCRRSVRVRGQPHGGRIGGVC